MLHNLRASSLITMICWTASFLTSDAGPSPSKGINVNLRAKWPGAPIILEAYEFLVSCMTPQGA